MKIRIRYRNNTGELKRGTARAFSIGITVLAMSAVALLSALITLRLAIHASEVEVPNLSGLTLEEAGDQTHEAMLNLTVENRFYSTTVPAGRVLSQSPSAGSSVRKGWHMRITESMGPQRVPIPDTIGMDQRDAAAAIRKSSLDLGTVAHIPAPGAPDMVLAQTPAPNAEGVDKPEVSLLLSAPMESAAQPYVMPNLIGMSFSTARGRMKEMNLPLYAIVPQPPATAATDEAGNPVPPPPPPVPAGPIASQVPVAGSRVTAAMNPHVTMTRGYAAAPAAASASMTTPSTPATASPAAQKPPLATTPVPVRQAPPAPVVRQPPVSRPQ